MFIGAHALHQIAEALDEHAACQHVGQGGDVLAVAVGLVKGLGEAVGHQKGEIGVLAAQLGVGVGVAVDGVDALHVLRHHVAVGIHAEGAHLIPVPFGAVDKLGLVDYVSDVLKDLGGQLHPYADIHLVVDEVDADSVFEALAAGDQRALQTLTSYYMKTAADMAVEMNIEEMQLADLIQEANLCLIQALGTAGDECRDEKWLLSEMRKGIQLVLEEQTQRKFEDDSLVARVEKLEHAVRDLNDGEDEKNAFTIDELAIILDMKVDEIRDILRLTGDDN